MSLFPPGPPRESRRPDLRHELYRVEGRLPGHILSDTSVTQRDGLRQAVAKFQEETRNQGSPPEPDEDLGGLRVMRGHLYQLKLFLRIANDDTSISFTFSRPTGTTFDSLFTTTVGSSTTKVDLQGVLNALAMAPAEGEVGFSWIAGATAIDPCTMLVGAFMEISDLGLSVLHHYEDPAGELTLAGALALVLTP